jgi:hypothetical protein
MFQLLEAHKKTFARSPCEMLALTIENLSKRANAQLDEEMTAREKTFGLKHFGPDWWELASKQYPITQVDGLCIVTSMIRDNRDEHEYQTWQSNYMAEALEKIEQLVKWKANDRKDGIGDKDIDLEKWSKKLNMGLPCSRAQPECCSCGN